MPTRLIGLLRHSKLFWGLVVLAVVIECYAALYFSHLALGSADPDRYYHIALSRLASEQGLLRSLPQVEDLGWGKYFPDKEFLFHVVTAAGYRLGGEPGVLAVVPVLGAGIILLLYLTLCPLLAPWKAAAVALLPLLLATRFCYRLLLLRPHLLAILLFCLLLWAILHRHRVLAVVAVLGFTLAYHAFYIPLIVMLLAWPLRRTATRPDGLWLGWMGCALVAGLLLNPYFPSNLVMAFSHVKIALGTGMPPDLRGGVEVTAFPVDVFLSLYGTLPLSVAAFGLAYATGLYRGGERRAEYAFLLALTLIFTVLSFRSIRAVEYATPALVLLAGYALREARKLPVAVAACLVLLAVQWPSTRALANWTQKTEGHDLNAIFSEMLATSGPVAAGSKIFNCEWDLSPYILYANSGLRFVDILDPSLLWLHDPGIYAVRQRLIAGRSPTPADELRAVFNADFVLCTQAAFSAQMRADPANFELLAETRTVPAIALYRLRPIHHPTPP